MKKYYVLTLLAMLLMSACASVSVRSDYDKQANFANYQTFAFSKANIDAVEISDLDKKRIMRAIETELKAKGLQISESPDLLVTFHTAATKEINVSPAYSLGWGWGPFYMNNAFASSSVKGQLFIDLIDAKTKSLIWQGEGTGGLNDYQGDKRDERVNEFVHRIFSQYPPTIK